MDTDVNVSESGPSEFPVNERENQFGHLQAASMHVVCRLLEDTERTEMNAIALLGYN